jgi:hypothetical protein
MGAALDTIARRGERVEREEEIVIRSTLIASSLLRSIRDRAKLDELIRGAKAAGVTPWLALSQRTNCTSGSSMAAAAAW